MGRLGNQISNNRTMPYGVMVSTPDFESGNTGSTPVGVE